MTLKRRSFSLSDKIHICSRIANGESNKGLAKKLNVSHSTISTIWKKKKMNIEILLPRMKYEKCSSGEFFKDRITILVCANMSGSDKKKLVVIGKSKNPPCFKGIKNLPVDYYCNENAWMVTYFKLIS